MYAEHHIYPDIEGDYLVAVDCHGLSSNQAIKACVQFPSDLMFSNLGLKILLEKTIEEYGRNTMKTANILAENCKNEEFMREAHSIISKDIERENRIKSWVQQQDQNKTFVSDLREAYARSSCFDGGVTSLFTFVGTWFNITDTCIILTSILGPTAFKTLWRLREEWEAKNKEGEENFTLPSSQNDLLSDSAAPGQNFGG